jgi:CheY-like chemotaxis protein
MSGIEVLDHLRRDRPTVRVVIMSGNQDAEVARATLTSGGVRLPVQPVQHRRARTGRGGGGLAAELTVEVRNGASRAGSPASLLLAAARRPQPTPTGSAMMTRPAPSSLEEHQCCLGLPDAPLGRDGERSVTASAGSV